MAGQFYCSDCKSFVDSGSLITDLARGKHAKLHKDVLESKPFYEHPDIQELDMQLAEWYD